MVGLDFPTDGSVAKLDKSYLDYQRFVEEIDSMKKFNKKHYANSERILRFLALNGTSSSWIVGRACFMKTSNPVADIKTRRILNGREDRGKKSPGLVDRGLVLITKKTQNLESTNLYQLTVYGLLYTIKNYDFTDSELYNIARNYPEMFPSLFDKVDYLEKNHVSLKPLKIIAQGSLIRLQESMRENIPYNEILQYISMEYPFRFPFFESYFSAMISIWFYTYLMWDMVIIKKQPLDSWIKIIFNDPKLRFFYGGIVERALRFYIQRNRINEKILESISKRFGYTQND